MIDLTTTNEWQYRDPETGLVFPWYTKPALDEIITWELRDKIVCEYGGGSSTIWWNKKAESVFTVESNEEYFESLIKFIKAESLMFWTTYQNGYIQWCSRHGCKFDIIIIDGEPLEWRDDCIKPAIKYLKPGGKLIIDNWLQPSVGWMPSEESQQLLSKYQVELFKQPNHPDWQTAIFTIDATVN